MAKTATKTEAETPVEEKFDPPVFKVRLGVLKLAIWENRYTDEKGEPRTYQTATLERGYTGKDGNWVNEKLRMNVKDFGNVIALLQNGQQSLIKAE